MNTKTENNTLNQMAARVAQIDLLLADWQREHDKHWKELRNIESIRRSLKQEKASLTRYIEDFEDFASTTR